MTAQPPYGPRSPTAADSWDIARPHANEPGLRWVDFAGLLLLLLGMFNLIVGMAALGNRQLLPQHAHYLVAGLTNWGWIALPVGIVELWLGIGVVVENQRSRWISVAFLGLNAIAPLLLIPAFATWSLPIFTLNVVAIYWLVVYGTGTVERIETSPASADSRFVTNIGQDHNYDSTVKGILHPDARLLGADGEPPSVHWRSWWCAARKVRRAWSEWLAAEAPHRAERYHHFVCALAEEERAAVELERALVPKVPPR
jgi:hypothetical protein